MNRNLLNEEIRKSNENSNYFIFKETDLRERSWPKKGFEIVSLELKKSLNSLLNSSFSNVDFLDRRFLEIGNGKNTWVRVNKKNLNIAKVKDNTLLLLWTDYTFISEKQLPYNFGGIDYQKGEKIVAVQEIDSEVSKLGTTHRELQLDYLFLLPDDCRCEIKPTSHPDNDYLYEYHIRKCLNTSERVISFKDEIISQICHKAQLLNHKKQIIQEIINHSQNKELTEIELNNCLGNDWKENLKSLLREIDVNYCKDKFLKFINCKAESKTQDAETQKRVEEKNRRERGKIAEELSHQKCQTENEFLSLTSLKEQQKSQELLNSVKDNSEFLNEIKNKNDSEDLDSFINNKSPKEIIIATKRFEFDKDKEAFQKTSSSKKYEKEIKIKQYYHLQPHQTLADEQINEYLYLEATGQLKQNKQEAPPKKTPKQESKPKENDKGWIFPVVIGGAFVSLLVGVVVWRIRNKRIKL